MSRKFHSAEDEKIENSMGMRLGAAWNCMATRSCDEYARVDWFFIRRVSVVGVGELKARKNPMNAYPTVFLSLSKLCALMERGYELDIPAVFVASWTCGAIRWIHADQVDVSKRRIAGRTPRPGSANDQEIMIDVPISQMSELGDHLPGNSAGH